MNRYYEDLDNKDLRPLILRPSKGLSFRTTKAETLPKFSTIMKLITVILKQCKYLLPPVHDIFLFRAFNFLIATSNELLGFSKTKTLLHK